MYAAKEKGAWTPRSLDYINRRRAEGASKYTLLNEIFFAVYGLAYDQLGDMPLMLFADVGFELDKYQTQRQVGCPQSN